MRQPEGQGTNRKLGLSEACQLSPDVHSRLLEGCRRPLVIALEGKEVENAVGVVQGVGTDGLVECEALVACQHVGRNDICLSSNFFARVFLLQV